MTTFPPCHRCNADTAPDRRHRLGRCAGCGPVWWRIGRRFIPLTLGPDVGQRIAAARAEAIRVRV